MEMPIYLFTGFLEAGKTTCIQDTLADKEFNTGEPILLICCEEGVEEYDPSGFAHDNVSIVNVEDVSELTTEQFLQWEKQYQPKMIMVEYNGMWQLDAFYQNLPEEWYVYQEMLFIDATTIKTYNANMRQQVVDKLQSCEMVIFNRLQPDEDVMEYHQLVRTIARRAGICYEYTDGTMNYDEIEDPLPFDIDAPVVEIKDTDFAEWYRDMSEDMKKYEGKTVHFKGLVAKGNNPFETAFAVGRHVMTCCAADITYRGIVCNGTDLIKVKMQDWIDVTGTIHIGYHKLYDAEGPVLTITKAQKTTAPENPVATFY